MRGIKEGLFNVPPGVYITIIFIKLFGKYRSQNSASNIYKGEERGRGL